MKPRFLKNLSYLLIFLAISSTGYTAQPDLKAVDDWWSRRSRLKPEKPLPQTKIEFAYANNLPTGSLEDVLIASGGGGTTAIFNALNVSALPGNPLSTGNVVADIGLVNTALGGAQPTLGQSVAGLVTKIGATFLPGNPPSTGTIFGDLDLTITALDSTPAATVGNAVAVQRALLGTAGADVRQAIIAATALIGPGSPVIIAVIAVLTNKIGLPVTTNVISTDLDAVILLAQPGQPLYTGITNTNTILGAGYPDNTLTPPFPDDSRTKAFNLLARLNAMSAAGINIAADATVYASIEAWLQALGA